MSDLISRRDAIDALRNRWLKTMNFDGIGEDIAEECEICLRTVPSVQPDERMLHESCTDCPLYDKDRHSCPRFNKVIPVTLRELQSAQPERMTNRQWIDFLSAQFDISRTSAKEMLHRMMQWKKEDNFKKLFNRGQERS